MGLHAWAYGRRRSKGRGVQAWATGPGPWAHDIIICYYYLKFDVLFDYVSHYFFYVINCLCVHLYDLYIDLLFVLILYDCCMILTSSIYEFSVNCI